MVRVQAGWTRKTRERQFEGVDSDGEQALVDNLQISCHSMAELEQPNQRRGCRGMDEMKSSRNDGGEKGPRFR